MENYIAKIVESSKELNARERLKMRDFTNAQQIDAVLNDSDSFILTPAAYAIVEVHNEKAKGNKDYRKMVIIDTAGNKFVTGSESFMSAFTEILSEMGDEEFDLEVYRKPSNNYAGKTFITCSIV